MSITPDQIMWRGPQGYTVVLDEDMVSIRCGRSNHLEEYEVDQLIEIVTEAKRCRASKSAPTPAIPNVPF